MGLEVASQLRWLPSSGDFEDGFESGEHVGSLQRSLWILYLAPALQPCGSRDGCQRQERC